MFRIFKDYSDLILAFSEKSDGSMKFSSKNRERFFNKLGIDKNLIVRADLVHENKVKLVSYKDAGKLVEKTDGLLSKEKNLFLTITTADCLPIFIYDPKKEIIGLIHGGWKSLANNILAKAVKDLSGNTLVGIGPGISQCHFEVKQDLVQKFLDQRIFTPEVILRKDNKLFLDLKKLAKFQLIELGIREENIELNQECTFCLSDKYFSFRRDKPENVQTMLAIIGQK